MSLSERLNLVLLCGVFVGTTCGYVVGTMSRPEPPPPALPANWDPARADTAAALRASQESLTKCYAVISDVATKGLAH